MTLGRALDANESAPGWVLFAEPTVSRVHAVLRWNDLQQHYILQHRSRTNPTLVDGKPVEQKVVMPGQKVQLGLLVFEVETVEVRSGRLGDAVQAPPPRRASLAGPVLEALNSLAEEQHREAASPLQETAGPRPRPRGGRRSAPGGMRLVAAQGPDQGTNYPLRDTVLVVGRARGVDDTRIGAGVLLSDDSLPAEQALLVWQEREYTYGILQAESSPVQTRIRRVIGGTPRDVPVGPDIPTLLYEGDVIVMGSTSLVVRQAEPASAPPEAEEPEEEPAEEIVPPPEETRERPSSRELFRPGRGLLTPPSTEPESEEPTVRSPLRSWRADAPPADDESMRMRRGMPPRHLESIAESESAGGVVPRGLPPHLEKSLREGPQRREEAPPPPVTEDLESFDEEEAPPLFDPDAMGSTTNPWKYRSDFVLGFLEGPRKGQKISLLASELPEDRIVTVGSAGARINDIEVDEPEIANDQATLRYRGGRFTLINHRGGSEITVNNLTLGEGDQVVLMTGDRIQLGRTVLLFLERRVVEILRQFQLEVVEGVDADQGKVFDLNKERLMIGRGRNVDIRLADLEVSRVHCVLVHRNGRFYVQHRSDTNPTFVNGISLLPGAERLVTPEDRVQVSSHSVLLFRQR